MLSGANTAGGFFNPMMGDPSRTRFFGGGGGGGGSGPNGVFEMSNGKIIYCYIMAGRELIGGNDTTLSCLAEGATVANGTFIYAKVTHGSSSTTLTVHEGSSIPENTLDASYRMLYVYKDGHWVDCRWMPLIIMCD